MKAHVAPAPTDVTFCLLQYIYSWIPTRRFAFGKSTPRELSYKLVCGPCYPGTSCLHRYIDSCVDTGDAFIPSHVKSSLRVVLIIIVGPCPARKSADSTLPTCDSFGTLVIYTFRTTRVLPLLLGKVVPCLNRFFSPFFLSGRTVSTKCLSLPAQSCPACLYGFMFPFVLLCGPDTT